MITNPTLSICQSICCHPRLEQLFSLFDDLRTSIFMITTFKKTRAGLEVRLHCCVEKFRAESIRVVYTTRDRDHERHSVC